jgi:Reverse transcriptase (RNA-dependent DNA polymerase)
LLKACSDSFASIIARLANITFEHAQFPTQFKMARITPLLKRSDLGTDDPSNYRPISNLNTVSKILERLVLMRLTTHNSLSASVDRLQSAYRRFHSTETALLKVTDDIYAAFNDGQSTLLVALDLSAVFDCIDHGTLVDRLRHTFGLAGAALDWIRSYLCDRSAFVGIDRHSSSCVSVDTGVPQGSSLGPLLFSMYFAPLASLIQSFGIRYHQYADDTQLYIAISKENVSVRLDTLERCTAAVVHEWLLLNGLAFNPAKSNFVQFSPARCRSRVSDVAAVNVSSVPIHPTSTIKSLGVTLDCHLSFDQQVNNVCKNCYYHIRALRHVRDSLPDDIARMVACSIVTSRLDYCNSLYYNMSDANIRKLQLVQNTLARVVLKLRRDKPITPALIELHWLPVRQRINFKLATLTFKILRTRQPAYLYKLIDRYEPARILRSSSQNLLVIRCLG